MNAMGSPQANDRAVNGIPWTARLRADLPAGIVFQANVYDATSSAEENWAEALGIAQAQIPVRLVPQESQEDTGRSLPDFVRKGLDRLTLQRVDPARSILYHAGAPSSWNLEFYGRCRVGRAAFGTDRIPDGWAYRCNAMDEVWVPSEFNRETFVASGVDAHRIRVMRTGLDTQLFRPGLRPLSIPQARGFNFLSVSDLRPHKGTDVLLKAYLQEFKPDEDVALLLKISKHKDSPADPEAELAFFIETQLGLKLEKSPPVIVLDAPLPHSAFERLYASAHAFVVSARAVTYGRALLQALACGVPVIATRWGAPLEFLREDNSFPIGIEGLVPASFEEELFAGHRWAEPSVDHLRQLMRCVFSNRQESRKRAQRGRQDVVERWDWRVVIPDWVDAFRRLSE